MLFNSIEFLLFFPAVAAAYFAAPHRFRWILLLAASYVFYMAWQPAYALLLFTTTFVAWASALGMHGAALARRRAYLLVSLAINLGLLFTFKYFNLFSDTAESIAATLVGARIDLPGLDVLLPVGISFYTFQALSYSIDVYRGDRGPERHFGLFALYVSFFPQLVAGPIERSTTLLPQLHKSYDFEYRRVTDGLKLMAWGFFKKLVIADRLSVYVDQVYSAPTEFGSIVLVVATIFFAYQIYCDFSGYTDIAIGASQILGYDLMLNFRQPYHAATVQGFWRRWHISLSTWFRDYLYIPLGGNRVSTPRRYLNLFVVFVVSGLWHGAAWTFVAWGALHGFYLVFGMFTREWRKQIASSIGLDRLPVLYKALQIATTFSLVTWAWIFFRADSIGDAWYVATHLLSDLSVPADLYLSMGAYDFWVGLIAIAILEVVHLGQRNVRLRFWLAERPTWVRWSLYYGAVMLVLLFANTDGGKFIYFQF
ncbi:MAG: alginate O-acetyltransferase complex protein AlgI [Hyphomicrobiaceae bacterium]|jgi:alginate O-acetyltransferase complex protein AlgI